MSPHTIILSSGKHVDLLSPASLIDLTAREYAELLNICRKRREAKVA